MGAFLDVNSFLSGLIFGLWCDFVKPVHFFSGLGFWFRCKIVIVHVNRDWYRGDLWEWLEYTSMPTLASAFGDTRLRWGTWADCFLWSLCTLSCTTYTKQRDTNLSNVHNLLLGFARNLLTIYKSIDMLYIINFEKSNLIFMLAL